MVNYNSVSVLLGDYNAFIKLGHSVCAIYIWEYFTTLYFEWRIFPQIRQLKVTPVVYTICRISALMGVMCYLIVFNVTTEVNCNALYKCLLSFGYLAIACFSYLIAVRAIAIWGGHTTIKCIVWPLWLANVAVMLYAIITGPGSFWSPLLASCTTTRTDTNRANFTATFVVDLTNLTLCLVGVITQKLNGSGIVGKVLYYQAITWVALLVFVLPPVVLVWMDLNDPMNLMFEPVAFIMLTIFTTRMYRGLYEIANEKNASATATQTSVQFAGRPVSQRFSIAQLGEDDTDSIVRQNEGKRVTEEFVVSGIAV